MLFGRHFLIGLALVFSSSFAAATMTQQGISTYFKTARKESEVLYHVYSGATSTSCSGDNTNPCNSCSAQGSATTIASKAAGNNFSCNDQEVYRGLKFSITLSSSLASAYIGPTPCTTLLVGIPPGATQPVTADNSITYTIPTNGSTGVANTHITATFDWTKICGAGDGTNRDADCKASFKARWNFGFVKSCGQTSVDSGQYGDGFYAVEFHHRYVKQSAPMTMTAATPCNNDSASPYENVCHYQVFPGDEKVYLSLKANNRGDFVVPTLEGADGDAVQTADRSEMKYAFLRVYRVEGTNNFSNVTFGSPYKDLAVDGTSMPDGRIDGLKNGQGYSFIAANVDQAGNVTHFAIPGALTTPAAGAVNTGPAVSLDGTSETTGQSATPQPVYGLLDGKNCFVATAAYGSDMAPQVEMLRQFRSHYLLRNPFGKTFVQFYYRHSPTLANWIAESEFRRSVARVFLQPLVFMADLILESGLGAWAGFTAFVFAVLGSGVALVGSVAMTAKWGYRWLRAR